MIIRVEKFRRNRSAFTLVELLVVIMVISIISSMVLFALSNTMTNAKDAKTRSTITKINDLIMKKYESYMTRRVPLNYTGLSRADGARLRLAALRDLMRMEMPDRLSDFRTAPYDLKAQLSLTYSGTLKLAKPSVTKHYQNRASAVTNTTYESAECLYMIIAYGLADQEALERFNSSEIDDVDLDGLPEFIDGWGKPIAFLRWAPYFPSQIQMPGLTSYPPSATDFTSLANLHHDPFDPMKVDSSAFALYPLIYSAGPDKIFDLNSAPDQPPTTPLGRDPLNNPYKPTSASNPVNKAGSTEDLDSEFGPADSKENWHDNITNHELQSQ